MINARFHGEARREFLDSVAYLVGEDEIVIFAVAHFKRKPGYWKGRRHDS